MSRTKEYQRNEVIEAVTHVFWSKGYEATSMNDVVAAGGINKHSLYKEFGDKEGLFLACLDYYTREMSLELFELLTQEPLGLANIEKFFLDRASYADSRQCRGCFLVNSVADQEIVSTKVKARIRSTLKQHDEFFYRCLSAAQERGEISASKDCKTLASYLSCVLRGLMSVGRSKTSLVSPKAIVAVALETLRY